MKSLIAIIVLVLAAAGHAQQHTPTATTNGYIVTFDAEVVTITPQPVVFLSGYRVSDSGDPNALYMGTPSNPVSVQVEQDVAYTYTIQGFAEDPMNPNRLQVTDTITITDIRTRFQQIRDAWNAIGIAQAEFEALATDPQEVMDALNEPSQ